MELHFNTEGNEKQKLCAKYWIDNTISDIVYGGSKGSAKSFTGCSLIFGDALIYPETHFFIARKNLNDLRKFTIPSIYEVFNIWGISDKYFTYNGQDSVFILYNGSKVFLLDAKHMPSDPLYKRFGSMQMTRGWIEEAGEFIEAAKNNLAASVGRWKNDLYGINGKILQTCNPSKNYLYKNYYKPYKNGTLEDYTRFIQALPEDNKKLPKGYLEHLNKVLSKEEKERLLKGNWEYDDNPNALCSYDNIIAIFSNNHLLKIKEHKDSQKYITADIARFGSDKAIVLVWRGWNIIEAHIFPKSKTTEIQNCINAMREKHNIPAHHCIADEDGVGGGVVDNCAILGFKNNATPIDEVINSSQDSNKEYEIGRPNYNNLQTQCGIYLARQINKHAINVDIELEQKYQKEIIEELEQLQIFDADKDTKIKLLPKDKIKINIGRSPDWRDVLLMRSYFDLKPESEFVII